MRCRLSLFLSLSLPPLPDQTPTLPYLSILNSSTARAGRVFVIPIHLGHMGIYKLINGNDKAMDPNKNILTSRPDDDIEAPKTPKTRPLSVAVKPNRLVSLDVFRGLTVALMILVDDAGDFLPSINHSPWNGVTLADFVMPFFLFIVGVALALAYKKVSNPVVATRKAILRGLKLFTVGLVLQGGYFHGIQDLTYGVDIAKMRWMGVLQRIAIAYVLAAVCEIWLKSDVEVHSGSSLLRRYRFQLLVGSVLTITYMVLLYGLYVPDWTYQISGEGSTLMSFSVKCRVRGNTGPACNAAGMIDRKILGIEHLYRKAVYGRTMECSINSPRKGPLPPNAPSWCQAPFDPEGILSSVMAIVTCLIGLQFGHVIVHFQDHRERIMHWMVPSFSLLTLGFALDFFGLHMNKPLYSLSYTCVTAAAAGLVFVGIYILVDISGYRRPTYAMEWMGKHALMIFILVACNIIPIFVQGFYYRHPQNNILKLIGIGS
ncbi:heparan-alpha-glucosaminide N-acetyltransferase-like [Dioscorea cayenensis subsp. rotundata]|uniref:Heparan-alpha-glucosaminide N-acetyltransferase-like n=1 Tax=Dioscorea cayennensis subsp. rotundata TaxID=55577 RepID=A0AB40C4Y0_DIOCR|nr:heparan-alpha-glucosaminide N-acetyltransferase-like [Dioscorea cayenensis subsp. rotundata]